MNRIFGISIATTVLCKIVGNIQAVYSRLMHSLVHPPTLFFQIQCFFFL